jgi:amidase
MRQTLEAFFELHDVLLCPVAPCTAPTDTNEPDRYKRTILVNGQQRPYFDQLTWCSLATIGGLPSTVVPIGVTSSGMPAGIQVIGRYLDDLTTIEFASLVSGHPNATIEDEWLTPN